MRMEIPVQSGLRVAAFRTVGQLGFLMATVVWLWAQAGHLAPAKPPGPETANRIDDLRRKLASTRAVDVTAERAIGYSRTFLVSAENARQSGLSFKADRLTDAAGALFHVAEHQQHIRTGGGPAGAPPAASVEDHLQRVYFRTQQADYFLSQAHDARAQSLPRWARDFYQLAVRAYERKDLVAADENAKCADEIVKALEDLAQAATRAGIPVPPPAPPPKPPLP
jgi:hypothetical protein